MTEATSVNLLPLGTVVNLSGREGEYMIISRGFVRDEDEAPIARYRVVQHPDGLIPGQEEIVTILSQEIIAVVYQGLASENEVEIVQKKLASLTVKAERMGSKKEKEEKVTSGSRKERASITQESQEEKLRKDPFYKFEGVEDN